MGSCQDDEGNIVTTTLHGRKLPEEKEIQKPEKKEWSKLKARKWRS